MTGIWPRASAAICSKAVCRPMPGRNVPGDEESITGRPLGGFATSRAGERTWRGKQDPEGTKGND